MPGVGKLGKNKKATVIIKKTRAFTTYPKCYKSYKPLYEKVKNNNHYLAKALSKEKQENHLLFKRNIALDAEYQELVRSYNKKDKIMINMVADAKMMINMFVTATGYLTNYISSCQEFISRTTPDMQLSRNSVDKKESARRLSTRSPTRGIVKPMVSGHTITKPTISLRRVNLQHINHPTNLDTIAESPNTPSRNEMAVENDLPGTSPSNRENHFVNRRAYRLPERRTIEAPRVREENEQRSSKRRSKRSERLSNRRSKSRSTSSRFSNSHNANIQSETAETIENPSVKLNDVSKLLKNSQRINVRLLNEQDFVTSENIEDGDDIHNDNSNNDILMPEAQLSIESSNEDINESTMNEEKQDHKQSINNNHAQNNKNKKYNNTSSYEDPLEGPSWLFNQCEGNSNFETNEISINNNKNSYNVDLKTKNIKNRRRNKSPEELDVSLPSPENLSYSEEKHSVIEETDNTTDDEGNKENNFRTTISSSQKFLNDVSTDDEEVATNFSKFITKRRGHEKISYEDFDDFTLIVPGKSKQKRKPFDMNDLRLPEVPTIEPESEDAHALNLQRQSDLNNLELPNLDCSNIVPTIRTETEPEITATIQKKVQNCATSIAFNSSITENIGRTTIYNIMYNDETIKLLTDEDFYKDTMAGTNKKLHVRKTDDNQEIEFSDTEHVPIYKKKSKQEKKMSTSKDPSCAKVVLQKLSESHVKQKSPPPENTTSRESTRSQKKSLVPLVMQNSSDSECSDASTFVKQDRPRRRKAPKNLREPNLNKKLRRNE